MSLWDILGWPTLNPKSFHLGNCLHQGNGNCKNGGNWKAWGFGGNLKVSV